MKARNLCILLCFSVAIYSATSCTQPTSKQNVSIDTVTQKKQDITVIRADQNFEYWAQHGLQTTDSFYAIKRAFANWGMAEIKRGAFWGVDSCQGLASMEGHDSSIKKSLELFGTSIPCGIPGPDDLYFRYGDINKDGKTDALVTFVPNQCDGGNLSMWTEFDILIMSKGDQYLVDDALLNKALEDMNGPHRIDSVGNAHFYGIAYEFRDGDGHCCPSVQKRFSLEFKTGKIKYLSKKIMTAEDYSK